MTAGTYVLDAAGWDALMKALLWIAFLGGIAGAVLLSAFADVYRWMQRRIDMRQGNDEFADAVQRVVSKMDRGHG